MQYIEFVECQKIPTIIPASENLDFEYASINCNVKKNNLTNLIVKIELKDIINGLVGSYSHLDKYFYINIPELRSWTSSPLLYYLFFIQTMLHELQHANQYRIMDSSIDRTIFYNDNIIREYNATLVALFNMFYFLKKSNINGKETLLESYWKYIIDYIMSNYKDFNFYPAINISGEFAPKEYSFKQRLLNGLELKKIEVKDIIELKLKKSLNDE